MRVCQIHWLSYGKILYTFNLHQNMFQNSTKVNALRQKQSKITKYYNLGKLLASGIKLNVFPYVLHIVTIT